MTHCTRNTYSAEGYAAPGTHIPQKVMLHQEHILQKVMMPGPGMAEAVRWQSWMSLPAGYGSTSMGWDYMLTWVILGYGNLGPTCPCCAGDVSACRLFMLCVQLIMMTIFPVFIQVGQVA
jgi:hypothetical protein